MEKNLDPPGIDVIDEVLQIWRTFDPVEGYAAGLKECEGEIFIPDKSATDALSGRISMAASKLDQIADADCRTATSKLLAAISMALQLELPQVQVFNCGAALLYVGLKDSEKEDFVSVLLQNIVAALKAERARWTGETFSGQTAKAVADAVAFLDEMFSKTLEKNQSVASLIKVARNELRAFRALFPSPLSDEIDELFSFFEQYSVDSVSRPPHSEILEQFFNYDEESDNIVAQSLNLLRSELALIQELIPKLVNHLKIDAKKDNLGDIYDKLTKKYELASLRESDRKLDVLTEAQNIMKAVDKYIECYVQDIPDRSITLRATPPALTDLVTSGATVVLDYLQPKPDVFIFITEQKNTSWLTLLNVLVHEATHAYQPMILADKSELPGISKLRTLLGVPFMEASAFHRELEVFEELKRAEEKRYLNKVESEFLGTFDASKFSNRIDVDCFELETRVWRVMRALRSICDIEVNSGRKTYIDFIDWAVKECGLKKKFIHDECFTFLSTPGYTPSYSFCGGQYAELQHKAAGGGVNRLDFNTQANAMGLWPWRLCFEKMNQFRATSTSTNQRQTADLEQ
jgi:hypothetical protein